MDFVIAVDGTAASGKGTLAAGLAREFGLPHLDTGLLYRAVGHHAAQTVPPFDEAQAAAFAERAMPETLDNPAYRTAAAGEAASRVAAMPGVRAGLLAFQRRFARQPGGAVLDGRDIATVIAPFAAAKIYVDADLALRAHRRWLQLSAQGDGRSEAEIAADLAARDARDCGRADAPLARAPDAVLLDTTPLSISQAAEAARRIVQAARARWLELQASALE